MKPETATGAKPKSPPRPRDLARADTLRARDIYDLYGIAPSTLCWLATHPDAARRPLSRFIRGRGGRRGIRLFPRVAFEQWLARWDASGEFKPAA